VTRRRNVREKGNFSSDYRPERMTEPLHPFFFFFLFLKVTKKEKRMEGSEDEGRK
jgi:hypothetical protein